MKSKIVLFYKLIQNFLQALCKTYREALVKPYSYAPLKSYEKSHCLNCNADFHGRFCPYCGQSAATKRFKWQSMGHIFLQLFGWADRSVPRTLWHLIYRPGYMIGDYLFGRRMPYFPPIKLLFVLATSVAILSSITPKNADVQDFSVVLNNDSTKVDRTNTLSSEIPNEGTFSEKDMQKLHRIGTTYIDWARNHKAFELLFIHTFLALISWRIFRKTKRNAYLTLPEHFYVQIYLACQLLFLRLLYSLFTFSHVALEDTYGLPEWFVFLVLLYDYQQLFGEKWKGMLWRTFLFFICIFLLMCILIFGIGFSIGSEVV
ncbi:MAG: DUF3667 domain-containing protein [Prevotella sp.]|nr:DUF3667 domain-containing protein [Prevotella sp.]MDY4217943.1 DUF3667 domain-containing protein [Prevotella sp.]